MKEDVRDNLTNIVVIWLIALFTCSFGLAWLYNNASTLTVGAFSWGVFLIPCAGMLLAPFAISLLADRIGRQLYVVMVVVSVAFGLVTMVVTSGWLADPGIQALLLANTPGLEEIVPILQSPITMLRDIAAFIVCPTVGCILGAWVGSRLHPVKAQMSSKKQKKRRK
ncbi:MAG: hypothetical protein E7Z99_01960 [Coriobacteriaceae bacterium]|nr:hypothetical protein [Coriobacteriaceae bacterium]